MISRIEKAISCFKDDFNCAQSIFSTYSEQFGLDRETALKISTGFGGGMGRLGNTCGAVSGAFMVIGLKYGMRAKGDIKTKEKTYQYIREFSNKFQKKNGSIICRDILGCDINTPEGREYFSQNDLFEKKCLHCIKTAAEILEEML
ncbi:MAG: C-GCAxxG-C-C family protein [Promethearchaeota archaeon]|jgi:C_GCAxxG_C_C family probable redox protein